MSDTHELRTQGPLRYPGGKNGMYSVHCSCGYSTAPDSTEARAMKPAKAHKEAKEAHGRNLP
jgi:hypothetical protein